SEGLAFTSLLIRPGAEIHRCCNRLARFSRSRARSERWIPSSLRIYIEKAKEAGVSTNAMTIEGRTVLITGANRGIGQALVEEALRRGAKRVYAGTRQPLAHADERVTPLALDVTVAGADSGGGGESRIARHP